MVDIETELFDDLEKQLTSEFPGLCVSSSTTLSPSDLPHLSGYVADSYVYTATADSASAENHTVTVWEFNSFSNLSGGGKEEAKKIMLAVRRYMTAKGFVTKTMQPIDQTTQFRYFARFEGIADRFNNIYRR